MDDSQSAGRKPKRFFSDEFKRDAVRLIVEEKYTFRVAADTLGVREQSLRQWHAKLAPKPEPCGEHATQFGAHAVRLVHHGRFGEMVCYRPPDIDSVPIAEAICRLRTVDPHGSAVQAARALGISFGDCPATESPFSKPGKPA